MGDPPPAAPGFKLKVKLPTRPSAAGGSTATSAPPRALGAGGGPGGSVAQGAGLKRPAGEPPAADAPRPSQKIIKISLK